VIAQGSLVASKGSVVFREILIFTTNRGSCFRSNSNPSSSSRWSSDTVLAQSKSRGVLSSPLALKSAGMTSIGLRIDICSYVGGACGEAETCRKNGRNSAVRRVEFYRA
jgi:hypothetical protein